MRATRIQRLRRDSRPGCPAGRSPPLPSLRRGGLSFMQEHVDRQNYFCNVNNPAILPALADKGTKGGQSRTKR